MWDRETGSSLSAFLKKKKEVILIAILLIILFLLAGYSYYSRVTTIIPPVAVERNFVGIIRIEGYIEEPSVVNRYVDVINQALMNESIKAVVLIIDSGGGYADYVEQIYLDLLVLKEKKPLVASVVAALSGGYYIAVAADYIYVHPTSMVGNVGVKASMPPILIPSEQFIETGVYKWTGFSILEFPFTLDKALENFVSAVENGRGDRLKISRIELKKASIYLGSEAVDLGLADEIGSMQKAIETAAEKANLTRYDVVEIRPRVEQSSSSLQSEISNYTSGGSNGLTIDMLNTLHPPPAIHYIYLPSDALRTMSQSMPPIQSSINISAPAGRGTVIVDASHGNQISWWVLDSLIVELAKRNVTVSFLSSWIDVESKLDNASALIVASPTFTYSASEIERIEKFLDRGGMLLLFFDPSWEFIGLSGLQSEIIAPINSLSTRFGLSFAKGYLYNEEEYFGIYRNIYVRNFRDNPLTQNLSSLVMFTATHIYSVDNGVAWTPSGTFSSMSEKTSKYAVIASVKRGNGTVIAIGDLTFLMEPYCHLEDNYKLIANLASLIAKVEVKAPEVEKEEAAGEIARPDLPVGTRKVFRDEVDGEVSNFTWIKVSEREIVIERVNQTTHYYLNEEGALERWTSNGKECVYEQPVPEPPYPLTKGKRWMHETNYTLTWEGIEYPGRLSEENLVEKFENVTAGDGNTYFCARVKYKREDVIYAYGVEMKMTMEGYYWISSEAGTVKQEFTIKYYSDGSLIGVENEKIILLSIEK